MKSNRLSLPEKLKELGKSYQQTTSIINKAFHHSQKSQNGSPLGSTD